MKNSTIRILAALLAAGVTLTSGSVTTFAAGRVVGGPSVTLRAVAGVDVSDLNTAIAAAQAELDKVGGEIVIADSAAEAAKGKDWVTQATVDALQAVVDEATAMADAKDTESTAEQVAAKVTEVNNAVKTFTDKVTENGKGEKEEPTGDAEVTAARTALKTSIDAANEAKKDVVIGTSAAEVEEGKTFVTQAAMTTFDTAIATATEAHGKTDATKEELTTAKTTLEAAVEVFNNAKGTGTKPGEVTPPVDDVAAAKKALQDAIATAKTELGKPVVDTEAANVAKGTKWVLQADKDTFSEAITAAEGKVNEATADALNEAKTTLEAAQQAFIAAQKDGTKDVPVDPTPDTETTVTNQTELETALEGDFDVIKLGSDVPLNKEVPVGREVVIDGQGNSFTDGVVRATTGSLKITAAGVELKNLGVDVDVVVAAGGEVILGADAKAASVTLDGGTVKITEDADISTLAITVTQAASIASNKTETMEILDALVKSEVAVPADKFVSVTKADGSAADDIVELPANVTPTPPTPPTPTPTPGGSSSNDHDYFGTATWDEVKDKIADAKDGDTIKISGNGLKNFPASVARELKGKDITVEIRKNGVTYSINGLKIGSVDKLWYEFENLEGQLLTVSSSKPTNKPQNNNTVKPNPSTGR